MPQLPKGPSMPTKRKIFESVSRENLIVLSGNLEIAGLTGKGKDDIIDALVSSRNVVLEEVLGTLPRDMLKDICQKLDLDDSGREKQVIIDRLLGRTVPDETNEGKNRAKGGRMAKRKSNGDSSDQSLLPIGDYRHTGAKRKNNPPAKIAAEGLVPVLPKVEYSYSPRRSPQLRFDPRGGPDALPELLAVAQKRPLTPDETRILAAALQTHEPWMEWAGKHENKSFSVDPVALHIHERVSAQAIVSIAAREDAEKSLFADPQQEYREAVQFYKHDIAWTNRLILGDSLQVMSSLAQREDLAGKVQMIYMDPPYGIKFASNFQPEVGKREVKEKQEDLTREPEMVKAYRDTWHLGIHSYLSYLRDRLTLAKELLADTGSIFVQIGEENVHRVRVLMEEVFTAPNFVSLITVRKTATPSNTLDDGAFYLLWFAKSVDRLRFRALHRPKKCDEWARDTPGGSWRVEIDNIRRSLTPEEKNDTNILPPGAHVYCWSKTTSAGAASKQEPWEAFGRAFDLKSDEHWKTGPDGRNRLVKAERVELGGRPWFTKFYEDGQFMRMNNVWEDTAGKSGEALYVVQTQPDIVTRCMLMTTDPGDLVLDPTCGSGTTAHVAEQWGRRWITTDTSRVAVAIARQRLLTARYDYYKTRASEGQTNGNPGVGFVYKTVPHITLKSIAQNTNLDPIFARHEPILNAALAKANGALSNVSSEIRAKLAAKLATKASEQGLRAITDADARRWLLPGTQSKLVVEAVVNAFVKVRKNITAKQQAGILERIPGDKHWKHWEIPFDTDTAWPTELREGVMTYRKAWRAKMDEVNGAIGANAEQEELVDQPETVRNVTRVSGPFTVEAVQPPEMSLGDPLPLDGKFGGEPQELEGGGHFVARMVEPRNDLEVKNAEAYLDQMTSLLKLDGVRFPNNHQMNFSRITRTAGGTALGIHADGRWITSGKNDDDPKGRANVAVSFGPQYGPITAKQVEEVLRSSARGGYDALVLAGFSFEGEAQALIDENPHPKVKMHLAHIRPDVNPGMAGLLKEQPGSQLFTVFGQPRTNVKGPDKDDQYKVTMEGVDIYNPVTNTLIATGADKVAAWFIEGDYDGRTFCITQAFFPDASAWEKLSKALDGVVDADRFEAFSGTVSLPFPAGKFKRVAVKVIDPRGNEVMQVHKLV